MKDFTHQYHLNGFVAPVPILSTGEAKTHRHRLERAEDLIGNLHYKAKVHTVLTSPWELATHPAVLDVVESLIGPDILLYNCEYIIKEPHSSSHVSWHQDLTYWGFDGDDQVSMWLALSPATPESGCMRMLPGSHQQGRFKHDATDDVDNILLQGQTVSGVNETDAQLCPLKPGEASFHHGWTLHASLPNQSSDRRIGLNAQFIKPSMKQLKKDDDTAVLVRGSDTYQHFLPDIPAQVDLAPDALARFEALNIAYEQIVGTGGDA